MAEPNQRGDEGSLTWRPQERRTPVCKQQPQQRRGLGPHPTPNTEVTSDRIEGLEAKQETDARGASESRLDSALGPCAERAPQKQVDTLHLVKVINLCFF